MKEETIWHPVSFYFVVWRRTGDPGEASHLKGVKPASSCDKLACWSFMSPADAENCLSQLAGLGIPPERLFDDLYDPIVTIDPAWTAHHSTPHRIHDWLIGRSVQEGYQVRFSLPEE